MCRALLWFWIWAGLNLEFRAALVKFRFLFKSQILAETQVRCSEEPNASVSHSKPQDLAEFKHQFLAAENIFFLIVLKRFLLDQAHALQGLCKIFLETLGNQFWGCSAVFPSPNSCCEQWTHWCSAKFTVTQLKTGLVSLCFPEQSSGSAFLKISAFLIYKTRKNYYVIPKILWLSFTVHWSPTQEAFLSHWGGTDSPECSNL